MSFPYLTALGSDSFDYTASTLASPPWALVTGEDDESPLQALSGYCATLETAGFVGAEAFTGVALPNDQYVSITVKNIDSEFAIINGFVRWTQTENTFNSGYQFEYVTGSVTLSVGENAPAATFDMTVNNGDTLTWVAIGDVISLFQNQTLIGSITDSTYASGGTLLFLAGDSSVSDIEISNYAVGSASNTPPTPSGEVFLGSVVVVDDAPSGSSNPFLGTVTVIDSAPAGENNPYLGKVVSGSAPSGVPNPTLGNVVVIGSKPANASDVFLGTVEESS